MKKTAIIALTALLLLACNKKLSDVEQDYYTIIHEIVPMQEAFIDNSSKPLYDIKNALENGTAFNINQAVNDIDKIQQETKKKITEKADKIKSELGKKYIDINIAYIDNISSFSINMLNDFKNEKNKSLDNFIKLLGQSVAATQEKISKIMQEEENILTELQNKVEKK